MQKYYQNEDKFNGVYSKNKSPKTKDGPYVINTDKYESVGTHWIALYMTSDNGKYFDGFGV